jgi:hypothetical protein
VVEKKEEHARPSPAGLPDKAGNTNVGRKRLFDSRLCVYVGARRSQTFCSASNMGHGSGETGLGLYYHFILKLTHTGVITSQLDIHIEGVTGAKSAY